MQRTQTADASAAIVRDRTRQIAEEYASPEVTAPWLLCDRHPSASVAFRFIGADLSETTMTYGELAERSRRAAHALASVGVGAGDRVATLLGKGPDLPVVILGAWRLGAVYVPLFTAFAAGAVADRVADSRASVVVTDAYEAAKVADLPVTIMLANQALDAREEAPSAPDAVDLSALLQRGPLHEGKVPVRGPEAPLVHMFTSGTTGKPKTVVHPLAYAAGWQSYLEHGLAPGDVYWCGADPGWAYGLYAALVAPLAAGVTSVVTCGTFKPETTWRVLERLAVTDFAAAPTVYRALRASDPGTPLPALRRLSSAGEPLTPEVGEWARSRFGVDVHDHFGQTELGMPAGFAHHRDLAAPVRPRAMGVAFPGWSVTVLEPDQDRPAAPGQLGRLALRVADSDFFTFTGYGVARDHLSDRFTADGSHYLTGDLAAIDEEGLIRFSSRDDDVILMAGYRIGPFDVESVLARHPRVVECAVVAAPDEVRGEVIHAFVVVTDEDNLELDGLTAELQDWVRHNYGAHAYPRRVTFVGELPKTPSGKVQRAVLRRGLAESTDGAAGEE